MSLVWTGRVSPFDAAAGYGWRVIWAEEVGLFVATGYFATGTQFVAVTSADGVSWTGRGVRSSGAPVVETLVYDDPGGEVGQVTRLSDVAWSADLNLMIAVHSEGDSNGLYTSPNGITWTARGNPLVSGGDYANLTSIAWSPEQSRWVLVGISATSGLVTNGYSADGVSWTVAGSPANSNWDTVGDGAICVIWNSDVERFIIGGLNNGGVTTSLDGVAWTNRTTPFDDDLEKISDFAVRPNAEVGGIIFGVAIEDHGSDQTTLQMESANHGTTWTVVASLYVQAAAYSYGVGKVLSAWLMTGRTFDGVTTIAESPDGETAWVTDVSPFDGGGFGAGIAYSGSHRLGVVVGMAPGGVGPSIATSGLFGAPTINCEFSL